MATRQSSYPTWKAFQTFETNLKNVLEKIDAARRGQPVYEVERWPSGRVRGGKTIVVPAGDYSPDVCRFIERAASLISTDEVGDWIVARRKTELDLLLSGLHQGCGLKEFELQHAENFSISRADLESIRTAQWQERELRFLADFALICGRVHWRRWIPANGSLTSIEAFEKARKTLIKQLKPILLDRYISRRLAAQELKALTVIQKMLNGINLIPDVVASEAPPLHPYKRFHPDGRGERTEVATEIFLLCRQCFSQCPSKTLASLLEISDLELPAKFDEWLAEIVRVGGQLAHSFEQAQYLYNPLLPLNLAPETGEESRVWLTSDISRLKLSGYAIGLG